MTQNENYQPQPKQDKIPSIDSVLFTSFSCMSLCQFESSLLYVNKPKMYC
jgi:hypothetical protein